jgi:hypothetical protein
MSDAFLGAQRALEEEDVEKLSGLKVLLACVVGSYGLSQSGLGMTICNGIAPTPCSGPPAEMAARMGEIVETLRTLWGEEFDSNYKRYMLGPSPIVVLIPRREMIRIANARLDGRPRNGEDTQGLNIDDQKIVVVYDDIPPLFVARSIHHEIGHQQLRNAGLSRNDEEARVRKVVDVAFFTKVFGRQWVESTIAALEKRVVPVRRQGRVYNGYTPEAVAELYSRLQKYELKVERSMVNDRIVENVVFILTNTEESLSAALAADDSTQ